MKLSCWFISSIQCLAFVGVFAQTNIAQAESQHLFWSPRLSLKFSNGCGEEVAGYTDPRKCSRVINRRSESPAEAACQALGMKLPTKAQFLVLIRSFDHRESPVGPQLTAQGFQEMKQAFGGDLKPTDSFWTSTVFPFTPYTDNSMAYSFSGELGLKYDNRTAPQFIRCVQIK